jgi:hypothetical protein
MYQPVTFTDGTISETGTFGELLAAAGAFSEFLQEYLIEEVRYRKSSDAGDSSGDAKEEIAELLNELAKHDPGARARFERQLSSTRSVTPPISARTTDGQVLGVDKFRTPPTSPAGVARNGSVAEGKADKIGIRRQTSDRARDATETTKPAPPTANSTKRLIQVCLGVVSIKHQFIYRWKKPRQAR